MALDSDPAPFRTELPANASEPESSARFHAGHGRRRKRRRFHRPRQALGHGFDAYGTARSESAAPGQEATSVPDVKRQLGRTLLVGFVSIVCVVLLCFFWPSIVAFLSTLAGRR